MNCHICNRPVSDRYVNKTAGEACAHPCHWPYLSAQDVAKASMVLDRIRFVNADALRKVWAA